MLKIKPKKTGLNIIIVGCGKVGYTLTEELANEGHDITIIDQDYEKVKQITNYFDVMGLAGNGATYHIQKEAGVEAADLFIAVTDSDELNLLCCTVAKRSSGCATIARVRNPDYSNEVTYLMEQLGLAMIINPEMASANEAARILCLPTALSVHGFAHGQVEMVQFKLTEESPLSEQSIAQLGQSKLTNNVLICAVERKEEVFIPDGDFILKSGDFVSFVASQVDTRIFLKKIRLHKNQVKDTMIIGGGKAAYYLAKRLINVGVEVKIIEQNLQRCHLLNQLLPEAIVIHGDGTDVELLKEEGLESVEGFVPLTGMDEENIILTLHAQQVSKAKVITKINRLNFKEVVNHLDLGSVVYPKYITSEAILAYVRARQATIDSNVETIYHLFESRAEAIEFKVHKESAVTNTCLADLKLKKNLLVACIIRGPRIIIPNGNNNIQVEDIVVIVTTHTGLSKIEDILA